VDKNNMRRYREREVPKRIVGALQNCSSLVIEGHRCKNSGRKMMRFNPNST